MHQSEEEEKMNSITELNYIKLGAGFVKNNEKCRRNASTDFPQL